MIKDLHMSAGHRLKCRIPAILSLVDRLPVLGKYEECMGSLNGTASITLRIEKFTESWTLSLSLDSVGNGYSDEMLRWFDPTEGDWWERKERAIEVCRHMLDVIACADRVRYQLQQREERIRQFADGLCVAF